MGTPLSDAAGVLAQSWPFCAAAQVGGSSLVLGGEIPNGLVTEMCALLGLEVRTHYPDASCHTSKCGPKMLFDAALQNPTVDLIVALDRRDADGLLIPHLEKRRWDASNPEQHVRLLNADPVSAGDPYYAARAGIHHLLQARPWCGWRRLPPPVALAPP